jgi:AraC-like DNA-binding protein
MVCKRCLTTVKNELNRIGIQYDTVELGEVNTKDNVLPSQLMQFDAALRKSGFELIDDKNNSLIERLKESLIDLEKYSDEDLKISFSDYISLNVNDNFISLNTLFAEIEGVTIEKYVIKRKIEMVKELLVYDDFSLDQIALKMHYSDASELSRQFKRVTGLTPSHFRQLRQKRIYSPAYI